MKMIRVLGLLLFCSLLAACGAGRDEAGKNTNAANKSDNSGAANASLEGTAVKSRAAVGEMVVARRMAAKYYEGRVRSIKGTRAEIGWADNSAPNEVELSDVYRVPSEGAPAKVKTGEMVLARWPEVTNNLPQWFLAEVTGTTDDYINVRYVTDNSNSNLTPDKIITLAADEAARLKNEFQYNK
jgi:hypothetical protein